jgi:hypothetical protein
MQSKPVETGLTDQLSCNIGLVARLLTAPRRAALRSPTSRLNVLSASVLAAANFDVSNSCTVGLTGAAGADGAASVNFGIGFFS